VPISLFPASEREHLAGLLRYSLARQMGLAMDAVTVHRLVQEVTRRRQRDTTRLEEMLHKLNAAFACDASDVRSWPSLDPLAPHAAAVAAYADEKSTTRPTTDLMNAVGRLWIAK